jgi:hypothetical protein
MKWCVFIFIAWLIFEVNSGTAECSDTNSGWNEAGIRMGIQVGPKREYFHLYELFGVYGLPWDWRSSSGWGVATQLETSLGALHTAAETGFIGSLGTGLTLSKTGINLVPELGISVDLMDRRQFGRQDFGSILLFGAYMGLNYRFDNGLGIGYRILHLSNGHIFYPQNTPNPGVDLHLIGLSWKF